MRPEAFGRWGRRWDWLRLALVLWAIPAFLCWFAFGLSAQRSLEDRREETFQTLENRLESIAGGLDPSVVLTPRLNDDLVARRLRGQPARPAILEAVVKAFLAGFPPRLLQVQVFDGAGRALLPSPHAAAEEILVAYLRQPIDRVAKPTLEELATLKVAFPIPDLLLAMGQGRPGEVIPLPGSLRLGSLFFTWEAAPEKGVGGVLVIVDPDRLPPAWLFGEAVAREGGDGVRVVQVVDGRWHGDLPPGMSVSQFRGLLERFATQSGERFEHEGTLALVHRIDPQQILLAFRAAPTPVTAAWSAWLALTGLVSFLYLTLLCRAVGSAGKFRFPLLPRLISFLVLVFGVPLVFTGFFGVMFWGEESRLARQGHILKAQERLAELDNGFQRFLTARCLFYRRALADLTGLPARQDEMLEGIRAFERDWVCDLAMVVSSASEILLPQGSFNERMSTRAFLAETPEGRKTRLVAFMERLHTGGLESNSYLSWNAELFEKLRLTLTASFPYHFAAHEPGGGHNPYIDDGSDQTRKLVLFPARRIFAQASTARGQAAGGAGAVPAGAPSARDLFLDTATDDHELSLNRIPFHNGRFVGISGMTTASFLFFEFVPCPGPFRHYLYYGSHFLYILERQYLEPLIRANGGFPTGSTFHAISQFPYAVNLPDPFGYRRFREVFRQLRGGKSHCSGRMEMASGPALLTARRCSRISDYVLVHLIPEHVIDAGLAGTRRGLLLAGAFFLLFGIGVALPLYQRFLLPVRGLESAVRAMRAKEFDFALPVTTEDEFGVLAGAFNEALRRLGEMELARVVQQAVLPGGPVRCGPWRVAGRNEMMEAVGGDYFDFFPLPDGGLAMVLADVSGHGLSASLVTALAKVSVAHAVQRFPDRPEEVLSCTNDLMLDTLRKKRMMTAVLAVLSADGTRLRIANAGQCSPMVVEQTGTARYVALSSLPLGISRRFAAQSVSLDLTSVRAVCLYSDGLVECADPGETLLGYDLFRKLVEEVVASGPEGPATRVIDGIFARIQAFTRGGLPQDDRTLLLLERDSPA